MKLKNCILTGFFALCMALVITHFERDESNTTKIEWAHDISDDTNTIKKEAI